MKSLTEEIQIALDEFADTNWGLDRAKTCVSLSCGRLTVNISIVDKNGKIDKAVDTPSMKEDMKFAAEDLQKIMEKFVIPEPYLSYSGNHILLEYWVS